MSLSFNEREFNDGVKKLKSSIKAFEDIYKDIKRVIKYFPNIYESDFADELKNTLSVIAEKYYAYIEAIRMSYNYLDENIKPSIKKIEKESKKAIEEVTS